MAAPGTSVASAHGERSQEAFLRMETVELSDVTFSADAIEVGDQLTIAGTVRILETWPRTLGPPEVGYIGVSAPGPVLLLTERVVNGEPTPQSIYIRTGGVYEYRLAVVGRVPGRWHVHPSIAIEGVGTVLGPGQWITVRDGGGAAFTNPLRLLNGETIDLERYGLGTILVWHWLGFLIGLSWMLFWILPKPTVTRLAITIQIPLNTDGQAFELITKRDHRMANLMALGTVGLLAAGWIYQHLAFPVKIPQQVVRFEPPAATVAPRFVEARATRATYDPDTYTLVIEVQTRNLSDRLIALTRFTTSSLAFENLALAGTDANHVMTVEPPGIFGPGESRMLSLTLRDRVWDEERLISIGQPRMAVAGSLVFEDDRQRPSRTSVPIATSLFPTRFKR
jgi:methane/ammonia monooxygenase subunit B